MKRSLLALALLLMPAISSAQTVPTIEKSGRTSGSIPAAGQPVTTDPDIAKAIGPKLDASRLGQPNGPAQLDGTGKFPAANISGLAAQLGETNSAAIAAAIAAAAPTYVSQNQLVLYNNSLQQALANLNSGVVNGLALKADAATFQNANLVWSVCATGCTFTSPTAAWAAGRAFVAFGPYSSITINVSDGTYTLMEPFFTEEPGTATIHFVGNVGNPAAVVFQYLNITGNNGSAVVAINGGKFGTAGLPGMNGLTVIGYGAQINRETWNSQSYGAAFLSLGSGSNIHIGSAMLVSHFYYSVLADEGGRFVGEAGSSYSYAGDVNLLARHGGVIHCNGCHATTASHILPGEGIFGFNFLAEAGGALYVDGSTGNDAQVACFAAQTTASMWAHDVVGSGCGSAGGRVAQGAFAEFTRAHFYSNSLGIYVISGGMASVDGAELNANTYDGLGIKIGRAHV